MKRDDFVKLVAAGAVTPFFTSSIGCRTDQQPDTVTDETKRLPSQNTDVRPMPLPERTVNTISDLKEMALDAEVAPLSNVTKTYVQVLGYHVAGDGGGGLFYLDSSSEALPNSGTIFKASDNGAGRWLRIYDGAINVKWFGAAGNDKPGDSSAVRAALDTAIQSGTKTLFIPPGTYQLENGGLLLNNRAYSGLTICGSGASSILKLADAGTFRKSQSNILIRIDAQHASMENITIKDLALDGNKDNTEYEGVSGWGLWIFDDIETPHHTKNIKISNIWSYNNRTSGIQIGSKGVIAQNIHTYNNGVHGFATDDNTECIATNIISYNNGDYGFDIHGGVCQLSQIESYNNGTGGLKTSTTLKKLFLTNAYLHHNKGTGFRQTSTPSNSYIFLDNVLSEENGGLGFRLTDSDNFSIGKIISQGDNKKNGDVASISCPKPIRANQILVRDGGGAGIFYTSDFDVDYLEITGCKSDGMKSNVNADDIKLRIRSGLIMDNTGVGINCYSKNATISNVKFGNQKELKRQKGDIFLANQGELILDSCDFTNSEDGSIVHQSSCITITRCKGIQNRNVNSVTQSGDGSQRTFRIRHNLNLEKISRKSSGAKVAIRTQALSADASAPFFVNHNSTHLLITYTNAPPKGSGNLEWNWEIAYEKFDDR